MISKASPIICIVISLFSCGIKSTDNSLAGNDTIDNNEEAHKEIADTLGKTEDYPDCIRSQATSVINKEIFPDAVFMLNPDQHTGIETVNLKNGDRLIINNWGCEYFILTFRFETERFQADTTNTNYWLDKAHLLMTEIQDAVDAPLNLKNGIEEIPLHLASMDNRSYELGEEIVFKDEDIRDFLTVDRIQKINKKRFAIEISFATGPL